MRRIIIKLDRKHSVLENTAIILDQGKQQAVFIVLFTLLYLLRDVGGIHVPDFVFTGICAIAFAVMDMGTCLGMYMFTSVLTVSHNEISIIYLVMLIFKILTTKKIKINGKMLMMTFGMLLLQLVNITMFTYKEVGAAIYDYVTRMLIIILPLFWYMDEYTAEDFRSALMCYVAGVVLGGTTTMFLTADLVTWEALLKGESNIRLGETYNLGESMQTTYNSNQLAVMFSIATAILVQRLDQKQISKLWGFPLIAYSVFLVVLTRSRTGLLTIALITVIYYLILVLRRKRLLSGIFVLGMIGLLIWAIFNYAPDAAQAVLKRFVDQEDITNGRVDLFVDYIKVWLNNSWCFFFGYGIGTYYNIETTGSPHNALADILYAWGVVGFLLIVGVILKCWRKSIKKVSKKDRIVSLLPAIVALCASMAGQYLTTGYPHMRLCFLILAAQAFAQEQKKTEPKKLQEEN